MLHGRDGEPERALLVCDVPEGQAAGRCYAFLEGGAAALGGAEDDELIGRRGDADAEGPAQLGGAGLSGPVLTRKA